MSTAAYDRAKNWRDTQADIAKLFGKYGIGDTQWSVSDSQQRAAVSFVKDFPAKHEYEPSSRKRIEVAPARRIVVRLDLPLKPEGRERNSAFRVLYWYLKSKLEAVAFSFNDGSELLNFEQEFFGHTVIEDVHGRPATAFEAFRSGDIRLAAPETVIALPSARPRR